MAESSTSVRLLQHHLRQSGLLLAAGQFDAAAAHLDAALAIDPASLAALALRQRLTVLRTSSNEPTKDTGARANALTPAVPKPTEPPATAPGRFVPSGVDAASWTDFEQRVQHRRFRALIEAGDRAIGAGDSAAARAALEEARELQPDSLEASQLSIRIAMMPTVAAQARQREGLLRSRTFRAASLLLLGVSLVMGLDWARSDEAVTPTNGVAVVGTGGSSAGDVDESNEQPTSDSPVVDIAESTPDTAPDIAPVEDRVDVPVVASEQLAATQAETGPGRELPSRETPDNYVAPANRVARNIERNPVVASPGPGGEIPDNYVAPPRRDPNAGRDASSVSGGRAGTPSPIANVIRLPAPVVETLVTSPGAPTVPLPAPTASPAAFTPAAGAGAAIATNANEHSRVRAVLDQYAGAYGRLDVGAVRAVYPSVNERALAKAFSDLSSQSVSFDRCSVNIESSGATAKASCSGKASYVAKVGIKEPRTESRTVQFELKREGEAWKIQKAQTGR